MGRLAPGLVRGHMAGVAYPGGGRADQPPGQIVWRAIAGRCFSGNPLAPSVRLGVVVERRRRRPVILKETPIVLSPLVIVGALTLSNLSNLANIPRRAAIPRSSAVPCS